MSTAERSEVRRSPQELTAFEGLMKKDKKPKKVATPVAAAAIQPKAPRFHIWGIGIEEAAKATPPPWIIPLPIRFATDYLLSDERCMLLNHLF